MHTIPKQRLLCHQCNQVEKYTTQCTKCADGVCSSRGIRIQHIVGYIQKAFPDFSIVRVDTDNTNITFTDIEEAQIVVATSQVFSYPLSSFDLTVGVLFESDLTISHFQIEENILLTYKYLQNLSKAMYIQTFVPDLPLLDVCISHTYVDNLSSLLKQRKDF